MEYFIIILLCIVNIFLILWIRNLVLSRKKAVEAVYELEDLFKYFTENSLSQVGKGNSLWMHEPGFKLMKEDAEVVQKYISEFRKRYFDAFEFEK